MNLDDLKTTVAENAGLTKADAARAVSSLTDAVAEALAKGEKITMVGFGTLEVVARGARTGRNPRTGEAIKIAASKAVKFKAGKALKDAVNR
jgi:DNA-binding protein HU-beta